MEKEVKPETEFRALQKLKRDLNGHMTEAAKEVGCSPSLISRILDRKRKNYQVLEKLIAFRDKLKKEQREDADRRKKILDSI